MRWPGYIVGKCFIKLLCDDFLRIGSLLLEVDALAHQRNSSASVVGGGDGNAQSKMRVRTASEATLLHGVCVSARPAGRFDFGLPYA
mmetsp:Transcript_30661/g.83921  ORF Transcript_30661/g.83921 Transcript_30661/m.83921 type:complete len:87 (+) Transcript_30661:1120-1380(+)